MKSGTDPLRRMVLASVAAASGGCLGLVSSDPETIKRVSVGTVSNSPGWMEFSVTLPRPAVTTAKPAVLELSLTNTGDERREIALVGESRFSEYLRTGNANRLQLVPPGTASHLERENPECWKMKGPTGWGGWGPGGGGRGHDVLPPGETITAEFEVWAHPSQPANCIVPGTYEVNTYGDFELIVSATE